MCMVCKACWRPTLGGMQAKVGAPPRVAALICCWFKPAKHVGGTCLGFASELGCIGQACWQGCSGAAAAAPLQLRRQRTWHGGKHTLSRLDPAPSPPQHGAWQAGHRAAARLVYGGSVPISRCGRCAVGDSHESRYRRFSPFGGAMDGYSYLVGRSDTPIGLWGFEAGKGASSPSWHRASRALPSIAIGTCRTDGVWCSRSPTGEGLCGQQGSPLPPGNS